MMRDIGIYLATYVALSGAGAWAQGIGVICDINDPNCQIGSPIGTPNPYEPGPVDPNPYDPNPYEPNPYEPNPCLEDPYYCSEPIQTEYLDRQFFVGRQMSYESIDLNSLLVNAQPDLIGARLLSVEIEIARSDRNSRVELVVDGQVHDRGLRTSRRVTLRPDSLVEVGVGHQIDVNFRGRVFVRGLKVHLKRGL